jgi:transcriptional regulator with XRE-family HTH domain
MSSSTNTTAIQIWGKLENKEYRDSFVASNISNTVSSQIFTMREQHGWTQKQLAQRAGMGQSRIPALEDPNLENFEIGTLKRIASAFDVALVVRFVPFSELTNWTARLSEESLFVPDFANDRLELEPVSANVEFTVKIVNINAAAIPNPNPIAGSIGFANADHSYGMLTMVSQPTMYSPASHQITNGSPLNVAEMMFPLQGDHVRG